MRYANSDVQLWRKFKREIGPGEGIAGLRVDTGFRVVLEYESSWCATALTQY